MGTYKRDHGHRLYMAATYGGEPVRVYLEDQRPLRDGFDLVYIGPDWEDRLPVQTLPPDPDRGRAHALELRGFTDDPELVAATREFAAAYGFRWTKREKKA